MSSGVKVLMFLCIDTALCFWPCVMLVVGLVLDLCVVVLLFLIILRFTVDHCMN